jgi:hypothetical protein
VVDAVVEQTVAMSSIVPGYSGTAGPVGHWASSTDLICLQSSVRTFHKRTVLQEITDST